MKRGRGERQEGKRTNEMNNINRTRDLTGQFIELGADAFAWPAPCCRKVNSDLVVGGDDCFELLVRLDFLLRRKKGIVFYFLHLYVWLSWDLVFLLTIFYFKIWC